jgi:hypothetical protein
VISESYGIDDNTLWNYMIMRIIYTKFFYLPGQEAPPFYMLHQKPKIPKIFPDPEIKRKMPEIPKNHPIFIEKGKKFIRVIKYFSYLRHY